MEISTSNAINVLNEVNKAVLGKKTEVFEIMTAFLANGHVLLEDIPGWERPPLQILLRLQCHWTAGECSSLRM